MMGMPSHCSIVCVELRTRRVEGASHESYARPIEGGHAPEGRVPFPRAHCSLLTFTFVLIPVPYNGIRSSVVCPLFYRLPIISHLSRAPPDNGPPLQDPSPTTPCAPADLAHRPLLCASPLISSPYAAV